MKKKKILFIAAASGLGDRIALIPKLLDLKNQWYHVTLLCYEPEYFILFYNTDEIFEFYKKNNLYDDIIRVPRNKLKLIGFILRNLLKFSESYTPTNTFYSSLWWRLFSRKYRYTFKHMNDISGPYTNIIEWMLNRKIDSLYEYKKFLDFEYSSEYRTTSWIGDKKFITLFPSLYVRCLPIDELVKVLDFIHEKGVTIVLLWWERERRITQKIDFSRYNTIDLLGKTKILEASHLLSDSLLNISMDGGLMWLWHLMNPNNISIQNITAFIMQAPVNNTTSFNIRQYPYPQCVPCNYFSEEAPKEWIKGWIKTCVFYGTDREGECRRATKAEYVIYAIKKILDK